MTELKHIDEYRDPAAARRLIRQIREISRRPVKLMEVCGTHTMSIFRHGIRAVLPDTVELLSGPGCPVCVTAQAEINAFIELARRPDVILTTFGDLLRVPGSRSSLEKERAAGREIRIVYATLDALEIARRNPDKQVVFLGIGFETTAPTIAAAVLTAVRSGISNFFVYPALKRVMPALNALMASDAIRVDGFLLPGHVSVILGVQAYRPFFEAHRIPAVVAGFEPGDLLQAIFRLITQIESGTPALENAYPRAVTDGGNRKALRLMDQVFQPCDAEWRGLGTLPDSGFSLAAAFEQCDARQAFGLSPAPAPDPPGCACGTIITGAMRPPECPLFRTACTPMTPVGPCMVSSEGTCAAYYRYHDA